MSEKETQYVQHEMHVHTYRQKNAQTEPQNTHIELSFLEAH